MAEHIGLFLVVDGTFNRTHYPDKIGHLFEEPPSYAHVLRVYVLEEDYKIWKYSKGVEFFHAKKSTDGDSRVLGRPRIT